MSMDTHEQDEHPDEGPREPSPLTRVAQTYPAHTCSKGRLSGLTGLTHDAATTVHRADVAATPKAAPCASGRSLRPSPQAWSACRRSRPLSVFWNFASTGVHGTCSFSAASLAWCDSPEVRHSAPLPGLALHHRRRHAGSPTAGRRGSRQPRLSPGRPP